MKPEAEKKELRMRRSEYGPLQWSLAPPAPGAVTKFRRWNAILIPILVFLVLGAFVAAEAPRSSSSNAALQKSANAGSVPHANSIANSQSGIHGHAGS